jgi:hypothetical protein
LEPATLTSRVRKPAAIWTEAAESDVADAYGLATMMRIALGVAPPSRRVFVRIPWALRSPRNAAPSASDDSTT